MGIGIQALIAVRLSKHTRANVLAFRDQALALPEVVSVFHVTGRTDFLLHVVARNAGHLRRLALDAFSTWPEVDRIETNLIYEHDRTPALPHYRNE
jgi:DNA-binding Lrp family transcriptional regulator